MSKGFYSAQDGYVEVSGEVTDDLLNGALAGYVEIPVKPDDGYEWSGSAWIAPLPPDPAELLSTERATMKCSRLQGRLVLGEATCNALDAMADDTATPWAMRQTIQNAIEWRRTSQAMTELGYLLGYTDAQMDDLFRLAMTVEV